MSDISRTNTTGGAAAVVALVLAASVTALPAHAAPPPLSTRTHIFYYPWYQNLTVSGAWRHWQETGFHPPDDISSNYYPALGAYDSGDFAGAVTRQMDEIRQAGVGVIVYSWWGQGSAEDRYVAGTMAIADQFGIKVAWHIEPYDGRTAQSVANDIAYIDQKYGDHPAFFRAPTPDGHKGVFYVYNNLLTADWSPLRAVRKDNLVLAETTDTSRVSEFDGSMYTYAIASGLGGGWAVASAYAEAHHMIWAPSIGPGYIDDRAGPGNATPTLDRGNGATYDLEWQTALNPAFGTPTWITLTSFNEWHEGSQIEPASSAPPSGFGYLTYEHAYGLTGAAAEMAYVARTKLWVDLFDPQTPNLIPNGSFETASGSATKAKGWTPGSHHTRSMDIAHSGRWALRSDFTGAGTSSRLAPVAVVPGTTYVISAWVNDGSGVGNACLDLNDIPGELQVCASPFIGWQLISGTWNSGAHDSVVVRLVTDGNPNGPIVFDDIAMRAQP